MATLILKGVDENNNECACFYDSVTEAVFGVVLKNLEEAESFRTWCNVDLRKLTHDEFIYNLNLFRENNKQVIDKFKKETCEEY